MGDVLVFDPARRHNGDLIRDAAAIGWLPEPVFDATYGDGKFWSEYKPETLITNDRYKPADHQWNWRQPVHPEHGWRGQFGCVVFDPPYKLQGSPSAKLVDKNTAYGVEKARTVGELLQLIKDGTRNCGDLVAKGGFLLVKCQDQIVCNKFKSQTGMVYDEIEAIPGWTLDLMQEVDQDPAWLFESWLHLSHTPMPQRSQRKPRNNYSTLLAFKRRK